VAHRYNRSVLTGFPHIVCVNLDRRSDRWERMQGRLAAAGIESVQRFAAADGRTVPLPANWSSTPGAYGCLLSHVAVVRQARELDWPSVLILEDDVELDPAFRERLSAFMTNVPQDWDVLYFGALHMEDPIDVAPHVQRVQRAYSTYAYALSSSVFDAFLNLNELATAPVDVNNLRLQKERACYCFTPFLAWVEDDYSDAQGLHKSHWYLRESLVIHGQSMNELLRRTAVVIAPTGEHVAFLRDFYARRLAGVQVVEDLAHADREFVIITDGDVLVEEWDVCGNLRMCERYDGATGYSSLIELTSDDTRQLYGDESMLMRWLDVAKYAPAANAEARYGVFRRDRLEAAGGWEGRGRLRLFPSPNYALRLHPHMATR